MKSGIAKIWSKGWIRWSVYALTSLYVIYLILGFFVLPGVVKGLVVDRGSEALGRTVELEDVSFNPFTLHLELSGLKIEDDWEGTFFECEVLEANAQIASAFYLAPVLKEFSIKGVGINVGLDAEGELNIASLLEAPSPDVNAASEEKHETGATEIAKTQADSDDSLSFYLGTLLVEDLVIAFRDESGGSTLVETVGPMRLEANDIEYARDHQSDYSIFAVIGDESEVEWSGEASLLPLKSAGRIVVNKLPLDKGREYWTRLLGIEQNGRAYLDLSYDIALDDEGLAFSSDELSVRLEEFSTRIPGDDRFGFDVPRLEIQATVDSSKKLFKVTSVAGANLKVKGAMLKDGSLLMPVSRVESQPGEDLEPSSDPWNVSAEDVSVQFDEIEFADYTVESGAVSRVSNLSIRVPSFDWLEERKAASVTIDGGIGETGSLAFNGEMDFLSESGDFGLTLSSINLAEWQPYVSQFSSAKLSAATLNTNLGGTIDSNDGLLVAGGASVTDFLIQSDDDETPVASYRSAMLNGIRLTEDGLTIREAILEEPFFLAVRDETGVNLAKLEVGDSEVRGGGDEVAKTPETEIMMDEAGDEDAEAFPVVVEKIVLEGGTARFLDTAQEQEFRAEIGDLEVTVLGWSSVSEQPVSVEVQATIDSGAKLGLNGTFVSSDFEKDTDLKLGLSGYDLTPTAPYWKRYVGRGIEKGQLSIESSFKIKDKKLEGNNTVKIKSLDLGEKVKSDDDLGLPVAMGVALLKDRNGLIQLDIPLNESLDDPTVNTLSIAFQAIGQVIKNTIVKGASAPFSILGGLVGGSDDLGTIWFEAGRYDVSPEMTKILDKIAVIAEERPGVKIELSTSNAIELEKEALKLPLVYHRALTDIRALNLAATASEEGEKENQTEFAGTGLLQSLSEYDPEALKTNLENLYEKRFELEAFKEKAKEEEAIGDESDDVKVEGGENEEADQELRNEAGEAEAGLSRRNEMEAEQPKPFSNDPVVVEKKGPLKFLQNLFGGKKRAVEEELVEVEQSSEVVLKEPVEEEAVVEEERVELVEEDPIEGPQENSPPETLEELLAWYESVCPNCAVGDDWLDTLAQERLASTRKYLVDAKGISPERVFISTITEEPDGKKSAEKSSVQIVPTS